MVRELARVVLEASDDTRDHLRIGPGGVLPAHLVRGRRELGARRNELLTDHVECLPVEDLEHHEVHVHRMRDTGVVDEAPDFRGPQLRVFDDVIPP